MRAIGIVLRMVSSNSGVENRSWNGVAITPGDTPLTRMLAPASSLARLRVALERNALEPAYNRDPGPPPLRAAIELVLMMLPRPAAFMCLTAACAAAITDRRS